MRWFSGSRAWAVQGCTHMLVVDETRRSGGLAEALMAHLSEAGIARIARLTAEDSFNPSGPACSDPAVARQYHRRRLAISAALERAEGHGCQGALYAGNVKKL